MAEEKQSTSYGNIFKTTFLFGFVQVFRAVVNILKNKLAAILIGPEGMGILGIFQNVVTLLQTGAGLGVNQSAVRDISEANGKNDKSTFSKIITVVNKVILYTGILGCVLTLSLSYFISDWTFGDHAHVASYCVLSLVVALNIVDETKQAILKGMRQLRSLAKAGIIGSLVGLFTTIPFYYFIGIDGIVPAMLLASIIAVLVSNHYVEKIKYEKVKLSFREVTQQASPMIKMGAALMTVTLMQTVVSVIIIAYIRSKGGLEDVGLYSAGNTIINGYFGIIITALMTDYYPRIAAVNNDNVALQDELNRQSMVTLVLCCPMFVLFMTLLPIFIKLLYTSEFLPAVDFVKWSIYFTLITIVSNQVDMILVAKYKSRIMLTLCVVIRVVQIFLSILLYDLYGLEGLGMTYLLLGVLHMTLMCSTVYHLYKIKFSRKFIKISFYVILFALASSFIQSSLVQAPYYIATFTIVVTSIIFSLQVSKKDLEIDFISIAKKKIKKV